MAMLCSASGAVLDNTDAKVIIAANGGSDLIYVPDHDVNRGSRLSHSGKQDYVGGMFGRQLAAFPARCRPAHQPGRQHQSADANHCAGVQDLCYRSEQPQTAVQIADSALQQQGMHGSLGRQHVQQHGCHRPDFKSHFVDISPVGNADIVPTLAEILGFQLSSSGDLKGRVISEALKGGPFAVFFEKVLHLSKAASGRSTAQFQRVGSRLYFDEACFVTPNPFHIFNPCH
jgi:hypothetical protein